MITIRNKMLETLGLANETILDDPKMLLHACFNIGGPGSGKSYVIRQLEEVIVPFPKVIDSDKLFTKKLTVAALPQKIPPEKTDNPEQQQLRQQQMALRDKAMAGINSVIKTQIGGYFSLFIDGTGKSAKKMADRKEALESLGYDTFALVVSTSLPVAQERNAKRERSLPATGEGSVEQIWHQVQDNIPYFQKIFGSNLLIVNNDPGKLNIPELQARMKKFFHSPVSNPIGQELLAKKDKGSITRDVSPDVVNKF